MKILTNKQLNEKLAEVAEKTSRDIYDREELYRLNNRIEELERRVSCLEAEHDYRTPVNPIDPYFGVIPSRPNGESATECILCRNCGAKAEDMK